MSYPFTTPYAPKIEPVKIEPIIIEFEPPRKTTKISKMYILYFILFVVLIYYFRQPLFNSVVANFHKKENGVMQVYFQDSFLNTELRSILGLNKNSIITTKILENITGSLLLRDKRISNIIGLDHITKISELNLSMNMIKDIPSYYEPKLYGFYNLQISVFDSMKNLQYLDLSSNMIVDVSMLKNCVGLKRLNLSNNKIKSIKTFSSLIHLNYLNLANNLISNIKALTKLKLEELNISYNMIDLKDKKQNKYIDKIKNNKKFVYQPQK
tara:strand:- start:3205 stop:4008 length:804 start_codon:yes stop_codon:yes gene_type:complete